MPKMQLAVGGVWGLHAEELATGLRFEDAQLHGLVREYLKERY